MRRKGSPAALRGFAPAESGAYKVPARPLLVVSLPRAQYPSEVGTAPGEEDWSRKPDRIATQSRRLPGDTIRADKAHGQAGFILSPAPTLLSLACALTNL
jgi:hypothetical protein